MAAGHRTVYVGESSRSLKERFGEHAQDTTKDTETSHMAGHLKSTHLQDWERHSEKGDAWKLFKLEIVKTHRSAFSRQIHEAVTIMRERGTLLNSQEEYNRCLVPTLEVKDRRMETSKMRQAKEAESMTRRQEGDQAETNTAETKLKRSGPGDIHPTSNPRKRQKINHNKKDDTKERGENKKI